MLNTSSNRIVRNLHFENSENLLNDYHEFKEESHDKQYGFYIPSKERSIKEIHNIIIELSKSYKEIVVFAFDAIAFDYYMKEIHKYVPNDIGKSVLSSVFPTTTSTGWTSAITGTTPSQHGIYGTSYLLEKYNHNYFWVSSCLNNGDKKIFLDELEGVKLIQTANKTIFEKLNDLNFETYFLDSYLGSAKIPFLKELTKGAKFIETDEDGLIKYPTKLLHHFFNKTDELLSSNRNKKFIWNFVDYDGFIHENGYSKLTKEINWKEVFDYWQKNKNDDRVFLFLSDHGQIMQGKIETMILQESIKNFDLKHNSAGAGRTVYFYPKEDKHKQSLEWIKSKIRDEGYIFTKEKLIELGLFETNPVQFDRVGSYIAIAKTVNFPSTGYFYHSEHGALTSDEVYVPILVYL